MQIQDLKRWHWIVISVGAGLVLSYMYTSVEPSAGGLTTLPQPTFEQYIATEPHEGNAWLRKIVVYPPYQGTQMVTMEQLRYEGELEKWQYRPATMTVDLPYHPEGYLPNPPPADPNETVLSYLKRMKQEHDHLNFSFAWERQPWAVYTIWTGASVLLLGVAWPTIISLLSGGGLGFQRSKKDGYDLSRFGNYKESAAGARPTPASGDMDYLRDMEAELESKLASAGASAADQAPEPEVRKLEAGALDASQVQQEEESKEYKGEFYPVARTHGKKQDDEH